MEALAAATPSFHAFWMLCALGTVVCAAVAGQTRRDIAILAVALVATGTLVARGWMPGPVLVGVFALCAGAATVIRPRWAFAAAACGGALGGVWIGLLRVQGVPGAMAIAAVVAAVALSAWFSRRRPRFAPDRLREEALCGVCLFGAVVAMMPGLLDGWTAAVNLTTVSGGGTTAPGAWPPLWALALVGASLTLGMAHSLWSRR